MKYKYSVDFTYEGKRYKVRGNSKEELYTKKANKLRDLKDRVVVLDNRTTVDQWSERAFDTYKSNVKGLNTMKSRYKNYISPYIGSQPISTVRPIQCQEILNRCEGKSFSHVTKLKQELNFLFESAVDNQLIQRNPCRSITLPDHYRGKRRSITDSERTHLFKVYAKDPGYLLFILMLKLGCRPEEAIELIGKDIDHEKRLMHIRGTKTENADRFVPIPNDLYETIKHTKPFSPVAPNAAGNRHTESSYSRISSRLKRDLNLSMGCKTYRNALVPPFPLADDFTPYCLRHTYCTDLCKAGVDVRTAQKLMGHSSIAITANIYTHVDMGEILKAGELLNKYAEVAKVF